MKKLLIFLFLISSFIKAQPSSYSFKISSSPKELNITGMPIAYTAPLLKNKMKIIENEYSKINFLDSYFPNTVINSNNKTKEWKETSIYEESRIDEVYEPYPYIRYDNDFLLQASIYILPKPSFENEWKEILNDRSISYGEIKKNILPNFIVNYKEKLKKYNYIAFVYSNEQLMAMEISDSERMEVAREKWKEYKKYDYSCIECNSFQLFILEKNGKWKYIGNLQSKASHYNQGQIIRNILSNISQEEQLNNLYYKGFTHKKIETFYYSNSGKLNVKNYTYDRLLDKNITSFKFRLFPNTFITEALLSEGDIEQLKLLTKGQLRLLRNAIYARLGYQFKSRDLQDFFYQFDWYNTITKGNITNDDIYLSDEEKKRIALIKDMEDSK